MTTVQGQWNMNLDIDGAGEFPCTNSTVQVCNIITTIHQNLPSLQLTLNDTVGKFKDALAGGDGTKLNLTLGDGRGGEETATWNQQGDPNISHGANSYVIQIKAVLDKVGYMRKVPYGLYEGSASTALSKLASEVGLSFDGESTSDKQVWLPTGKPISSMIRHIVSHSFGGDTSAFVHGVTEGGALKFKDITNLLGGGQQYGLKGIWMMDYNLSSKGALGNQNRGAGSTTGSFDAEGVFQELNKIPALKFSNLGSFSSSMGEALGDIGGRFERMVRDAGNTHDKYLQARHQNARIRSTFANDLNGIFDTFTGANLLDPAQVFPEDFTQPGAINKAHAGNYIVSAKTRSLTKGKYIERITFTTQGAN